jgi:hypothetical protein
MYARSHRFVALVALSLLGGSVVISEAQAQRPRVNAPRVFPTTVSVGFYNPFINYPLTPYIGVGQAAAIARTLNYAAFFGALPPGYNPVANFPLTPYMGVGQYAGILSTLSNSGIYIPPYALSPTLYPPYLSAVGYPMYGGYGGGYGYPFGGGATMSTAGGGYSGAPGGPSTLSTQPTAATPAPTSALAYLMGQGGGLDWPLGLRILPPEEKSKELRKRIDDAMVTMFRQSGGPEANTKLLQSVAGDVEKLDKLYRSEVWDMALTRQQEADVKRFFRRVRDALAAAEEGAKHYDARMKTGGSKSAANQNGGNYGSPQSQGEQQSPAPGSSAVPEPVPAPPAQPSGLPSGRSATPGGNQPPQTNPQPSQPGQPQPKPQPKPEPKPKPVREKQG